MIFQGPYLSVESPHSAIDGALKVLFQATTPQARRDAIAALETIMASCPQVEQPVTHHFNEGQYAREIFNPKGSLIVTKTHKQGNFSFLPSGRILVISDEGQKELHGGQFFATKPGTKRLIYALEDTRFVTVHPNNDNCTDLEILESRIISGQEEIDKLDYEEFLKEIGWSHEDVEPGTQRDDDIKQIDLEELGLFLSGSTRDRLGIFCSRSFKKGEVIGLARIGDQRTPIGRYLNHSKTPNSIFRLNAKGDVEVVAVKEINTQEITINYRDALTLPGVRQPKKHMEEMI